MRLNIEMTQIPRPRTDTEPCEYKIVIVGKGSESECHEVVCRLGTNSTNENHKPDQPSVQKRARCHECGRFVSKKELAKVPTNGVPWCDACVSLCD